MAFSEKKKKKKKKNWTLIYIVIQRITALIMKLWMQQICTPNLFFAMDNWLPHNQFLGVQFYLNHHIAGSCQQNNSKGEKTLKWYNVPLAPELG